MSMEALSSALETNADLVKTLMGGKMKEIDQAMQTTKVALQMQVQEQEMAQTQKAVAMLTGIGGNLDTVA